jgi:hypothetical protein
VYLAQGIVPLLRLEDVKIAFARTLQRLSLAKKASLVSDTELQKKIQELNYHYNHLTSFIRDSNKEMAVALELFSTEIPKNEEYAYLYPSYEKPRAPRIENHEVKKQRDYMYKGKMLPNKMRFGTFLYYRGIISYLALMQSLNWQKCQRPLLGQIAMQAGFIAPEDFASILLHVKNGFSFGEVAKKKHLLSELTIAGIVKTQQRYNCKLGKYFVDRGILTENQVEKYLVEMGVHNKRFEAKNDTAS